MLILRLILAGVAVVALAARPGTARGAAVALSAAGADAALGAAVASAIRIVVPVVVFLAAALTLAATLDRAGLGERVAAMLAARGRGSSLALYAYVCAACAVLTATVSLDGAVVLMVPVLLALKDRHGAPFGPLFLGMVVVANASSIAVPQGNPTNLLIIERLGIAPTAFLAHMLVPGLTAALLCAASVAVSERRRLAVPYATSEATREPLSRAEREAVLAFIAAALATWVAPLLGVAPWWPFSIAVAVVLVAQRARPAAIIPWQIGVQITSMLIVVQALGVPDPGRLGSALPALVAVAVIAGGAAALLNNLPVGASAVALITTAPLGYAASIGLAVGSLATPQGSVATLLASELAGPEAPTPPVRRLAPLATAAVLVATVAVWTGL
jgi:Na+/H+ antiporter NhaD/arsenite permease-like protein